MASCGVWATGNNGPRGWDNVEYDTKFPYHGFSGTLPLQTLGSTPPSHPFAVIGKLTNYFFIGDQLAPVRHFADPEIDRGYNLEPRLILRTNDDSPGNGNGAFQVHLRVLGTPKTAQASPPTMPTSLFIGGTADAVVTMRNTSQVK